MESTKTRGPQQGAALMKRTTKYVALDVHQATTVASVRKDSGRVIARSVLPTDGGAIVEFVRGMRGAVHVTFEEGTQAQWLHDLLAPLVDRVVVCDRRGHHATATRAIMWMPTSSPSCSAAAACVRSITGAHTARASRSSPGRIRTWWRI